MTESVVIYRVETESGQGPYANADIGYKCGSVHSAPAPWEDYQLAPEWNNLGCNREKDKFYFGFSTPEQLLEWFHSDEFHKEAHEAGYRVSVIEVAGRVFHGAYQSIFERAQSAVTKRCTFSELQQLVH